MRRLWWPFAFVYFLVSLMFSEGKVPRSSRSREVVKRVSPDLAEAFRVKGLRLGQPVFIRVFKQEMALEVWIEPSPGHAYELFKTYPVANYGGMGVGPKLQEGDRRAPEGFYFIRPNQLNPNSRYHLSFNLGYPNAYDRLHGRTGSFLMVHGGRASIGCYAMTDPQIEEIYTIVEKALTSGQSFVRVHAFPFAMSDHMIRCHGNTLQQAFWKNLKEGYQIFEKTKRPPQVSVDKVKRRYTFIKS